mmetsp:Transcript_2769/g.9346  ORF Transcript_2769/g.9346 Transcript_2769/m.9346 type:complete len:349 (-) Transcript_2769:1118-2164(-)
MERQQPRLLDLDARGRNLVLHHALRREGLPKGLARLRPLDCHLQRPLGHADEPHAVVNSPWTEPGLRNLKATAVAQNNVLGGHAHVVKGELAVAMGRVLKAERLERPHDREPGSAHGDEHHGVARMPRLALGLQLDGSTHEDADLAVWVARACDPPLAPVEHQLVAFDAHRRLHVGRVGRGDIRLGHRKTRTHLSREQRLKPSRLLLGSAKHVQDLHVARVGRIAVEKFGSPEAAAHLLGKRRVFSIRQPRLVGQKKVPQARTLGLGLERLELRSGRPTIRRIVGSLEELQLDREQLRLDEAPNGRPERLDLAGRVAGHRHRGECRACARSTIQPPRRGGVLCGGGVP